MTKRHTRKYEMLVRVRNFGVAHQERFPEGSEGSKAFGVVAATVAQVDAFFMARLTARRESKESKLAAKLALAARIAAIARSARVMAKAVPGADAKFPLPTRQSDLAILTSGRLFLQEVAPVKEAFVRCGLPATFAEELQQAISAFELEIKGRNAGKTGAAVSRVGINAALKRAVDTVQTLDVLVKNVLGDDLNAMSAWKRDRHVEFAGRTAGVGAPSDYGVSLPGSPAEHPVPPASSPQVVAPVVTDEAELRRAS